MIAPNNIHPPKNWQDFEMLCLKLWGEIWCIPDEIDFNSDNAQGQNGVDIYGPVDNGLKYNGIQCKNKKLNIIDGSPNRITIADIKAEINKAKVFKPALSKLIIATSLPKDQKVEEFVRLQSVENLNNGLFSIQICFWEFFERKLPEFQKIYDWYLKNENHHRIRSASVCFSSGETEIIYNPKFQRNIDQYVLKAKEEEIDTSKLWLHGSTDFQKILDLENRRQAQLFGQFSFGKRTFDWHQNLWFKLCIQNSGQSVIEHFKLELDFEGDFIKTGAESPSGIFADRFSTDIHGYSNTEKSLYIKPSEKTLVPGDSYTSNYIFLKPKVAQQSEVLVYWKLLSKDFEDTGKLSIKIEPLYHQVTNKHHVLSVEEEKEEYSFSLIQRPGSHHMLDGQIEYTDKESDYSFEKL